MSLGPLLLAAALFGEPAVTTPAPVIVEAAAAVGEAADADEAEEPVPADPPYFQLRTSSSDGDLRVELRSAFSAGLPSGFDSFTLSTDNKGKPRTLFVSIEADGGPAESLAHSSRRVEVPTGKQSVELLLPVLAPECGRWPLTVQLTGPGVLQREERYERSCSDLYTIGSSISLPLSKAAAKSVHWVQLEPARLPRDWRAYLGFDELMLTGKERDALSPARWGALSTWVAQGGTLKVVRPGAAPARRAYGLGQLLSGPRAEAELGGQLDCSALDDNPFLSVPSGGGRWLSRPRPRAKWCGAQRAEGFSLESPLGILTGFFVLFFLAVGPLNLALCWRRRSRLLWSTPLISVLAAALLFGVVLLRDGVGGAGHRQLLRLLPGEGRELWIQSQASKTGLLLGGEGAQGVPGTAALELVYNAAARTRHGTDAGWRGLNPGREGGDYVGSWWLSRSISAHQITAAARSHRYLERAGERVRSNLDVPLGPLFLWEGAQLYKLARLEPGGEGQLEPAEPDELQQLIKASDLKLQQAAAIALATWPEGFIGQGPEGAGVIPSREDVDWEERPVIVMGVPQAPGSAR